MERSTFDLHDGYHTPMAKDLLESYIDSNNTVETNYSELQFAENRYFSHTFSVMLHLPGRNITMPLILAVHENFGLVQQYIAKKFLFSEPRGLEVEWKDGFSGLTLPNLRQPLNGDNMFPMLRLMQQRGGVDTIIAHEKDDTMSERPQQSSQEEYENECLRIGREIQADLSKD